MRFAGRALSAVRMRLRPPRPQLELRLDPAGWRWDGVPPAGFGLDVLEHVEAPELLRLLRRAGFVQFDSEQLRHALHLCVPRGCFGVREDSTGALVATMMARHMSDDAHPVGGRIDWLATDPAFGGLGLGSFAAAAATNRLVEAGYRSIWVTTDEHRPGAVKIFLKLGYRPVEDDPAMVDRWRDVLQSIGWPDDGAA
jgi:ribosomal protein S18 acetylase RimI-like enzyme